jgi:PTS system mannose-specific IIA component
MIGKLILTHGGLARELLAAANVISGPVSEFEAVSLNWTDSFEEARAQVRAALDRLDQGHGVLILTDMFGGTPCNIAMTFLEAGKVEVLTGVNLPVVLRLACQAGEDGDLGELARSLQVRGQRSLCLGSDMVQPRKCDNSRPLTAEKVEKKDG